MSLGDDWIKPEESPNKLDELGQTMNSVPKDDVVRGINKLREYVEKVKETRKITQTTEKSGETPKIDSTALAKDIMSDMER